MVTTTVTNALIEFAQESDRIAHEANSPTTRIEYRALAYHFRRNARMHANGDETHISLKWSR